MRNRQFERDFLAWASLGLAVCVMATSCSLLDDDSDGNSDDAETSASTTLGAGAVADPGRLSSIKVSSCVFDDEEAPLETNPVCYTVTVPEDWNSPRSGNKVELQVAVFEKTADLKGSDTAETEGADSSPIIYLDGGPGGHTLDSLQFTFDDLVEPHLDDHDFILFDQRGLGLSEPALECPEVTEAELASLEQAGDTEQEEQLAIDAVQDCKNKLDVAGIDLSAYNSLASANDVEAIRSLLEYEQVNVYGISYGTRLAQTYMRLYPQSVRSAVLDSIVPIEVGFLSKAETDTRQAFEFLFQSCRDDAGCAEQYPDFEERFYDLADDLDASPIEYDVLDAVGAVTTWQIDGNDLVSIVFGMLYSKQTLAAVPQLIEEIEQQNYSGLEFLGFLEQLEAEAFTPGMYFSVNCNEEVAFETESTNSTNSSADGDNQPAEESVAESDVQQPPGGEISPEERFATFSESANLVRACEIWDAGQAPESENEKLVSDIPSLLMGGSFDPVTPVGDIKLVEQGLSTSYTAVFPNEAHGVSPTSCGYEIMNAFLADPNTEPSDICIQDNAKPAFVPRVEDEVKLEAADLGEDPTINMKLPAEWDDIGFGRARQQTIFDEVSIGVTALQNDQDLVRSRLLNENGIEPYSTTPTFVDDSGRTWELYLVDQPGLLRLVAFNESDGGVLVEIGFNDSEELVDLLEKVLLPGLESIEVAA